MSAALEVLLIDNAGRDLANVPGLLADAGYAIQPQRVGSAAALHAALASQAWDIAVCAYHAAGLSGLAALALLRAQVPHLPVVVLSGVSGEEAAVAAMKAGAADYVTQTGLARLVPALREAWSRRGDFAAAPGRNNAAHPRFRAAMEASGDAIFLVERATMRFIDFNRAACEDLGYSRQEMLDLGPADILPQVAREIEANCAAPDASRPMSGRVLAALRRKDGAQIPVEVASTAFKSGDSWLIVATVRAIHSRLAAENALRESEAGLRRAQLLARLAHIITRPDGSFERFSDSLLDLLGVDAAHVPPSTRAWLDILHPEDRENFRAISIKAGVLGTRVDVEYRLRHAGGAWLHVHQVIEPLHGPPSADGKTRWFCTLQDVTEQKRTEEKIRRLNLDLERDMRRRIAAEQEHAALEAGLREAQKMESLGTLAGGIAHDFNNLLAAMLGNVSLARTNLEIPNKVRHHLDQVDKAGARAKELVKQILSFSRKQPQQFVVQPMRAVVIEALSLLRSTLPAGVDLIVSTPDGPPTYVNVDGGQISQVLMNLCTNAWHATSGVSPRIEVVLDEVVLGADPAQRPGGLPAGPYVRLQVKDNGHGMDQDTQAHIFEPFFTTKPAGQGTGLGLAVVHGIVKTHDGAIAVESAVSGGTTVTVYLPAVVPREVPAAESPAALPAAGLGQHVMYVDDYDAMGELVSEALRAAGYRVTVHGRGETALADVRADPQAFALIITDQNMPGMAGTELARQIRLIRTTLPVVISSGYISEELKAKAREVGVAEVIDKTRNIERLAGSVRGWIDAGKRCG